MSLTVVGLGPGVWEMLTAEAIDTLHGAAEVYVRSVDDVEHIRTRLPNTRFRVLDLAESREIAMSLEREGLELAALVRGKQESVLAVPGTPLEAPALRSTLHELPSGNNPVRLVHGVSLASVLLEAANAGPWVESLEGSQVALMGQENALGEVTGLASRLPWRAPVPTATLLVCGIRKEWLDSIARWLCRYYPPDHPLMLISRPGTSSVQRTEIALHEITSAVVTGVYGGLLAPPLSEMSNRRTFAGLMELTRTLRAPGGCPWDREQTHGTLKPHLLEETYEVLDALDTGDPNLILEEMGDLLFQITIHSQVAAEAGTFTIEDVISNIMTKLIGRHPHVFGDLQLESAQDVRHAWETFKQREKPKRSSVLEQIPRGLPALPQSNLMQKRAAGVGFEWPGFGEVFAKVEEELGELRAEVENNESKDAQREEFGDILFAMVSLARHLKLDPEEALRLANGKFAARFTDVEKQAAAAGRNLRELSPEELDALWNQAKNEAARR